MDSFDEIGGEGSYIEPRERGRFSISEPSLSGSEMAGEDMQEAQREVELSLERERRVLESQRRELEKLQKKQEDVRRRFLESEEDEEGRQRELQRELSEIRQELSELLHELVPLAEQQVFSTNRFEDLEYPRDLVDIEEAIAQVAPERLPRLGEVGLTVLFVYAEGIRQLLRPHLRRKTIGNTMRDYLKALTIAASFGPDRALVAILRKDSLWRKLHFKDADYKFDRFLTIGVDTSASMDMDEILESEQTLKAMRAIYYALFRRDGFDLRTSAEQDLREFGFLPEEIPAGDLMSHSEPRPSRVRFPSPGRIPRMSATKEQVALNEAQLLRLVQIHEQRVFRVRREQQERSTLARPFASPKARMASKETSQPTEGYAPWASFKATEKVPLVPQPGIGGETHALSTIRKSKEDAPGFLFLRNEDAHEKHSNKSTQVGGAAQHQSPWTSQGPRVLREFEVHPEYRMVPPQTSGFSGAEEVLGALDKYSVPTDGPTAATAVGVSSGVSRGIVMMTKEAKDKFRPSFVKIPPPSLEDDRRMITFDFNIRGRNQDEILGETFRRTCFPNEGARQETMRAIFQRVIDDPLTPSTTKQIALGVMDQLDVTKLHTQNANLSALRAVKIMAGDADEERESEFVEPPILGDNPITNNSIKSLYAIMGIDNQQKFSISDPQSKPLKFYLRPLAARITAERLSENDAYSLLSNVVKGPTQEQVQNAWYIEKIPFRDFWMMLQRTANKITSVQAYTEELFELLTKRPVHLEQVLTEIKNLRIKIHANEKNPQYRKEKIESNTVQDFQYLLMRHYSSMWPVVYNEYQARLKAREAENHALKAFGQAVGKPNKVYTMMEVICTLFAENHLIGEGRPGLFGESRSLSSGKEEKKNHNNNNNGRQHAKFAALEPEEKSEKPKKKNKNKKEKPKAQVDAFQDNGNAQQQQQQQQQQQPQQQQQQYPQQQYQQQPQMQNGFQNQQNSFRYNGPPCELCNFPSHGTGMCKLYPNISPTGPQCSQCGGRHASDCRKPHPWGPKRGAPSGTGGSRRDRETLGLKEVMTTLAEIQKEQKNQGARIDGLANGGRQGIPPHAMLTPMEAAP